MLRLTLLATLTLTLALTTLNRSRTLTRTRTLSLTRPMACYGNLPLTVALYAPLALGVSIRRRHAALAGGLASTGQTPTARTLSAASLAPPLLALAAAECARLGSAYILALLWLGLGLG